MPNQISSAIPREPRTHGDVMFPLSVYFVTLTPGPKQEIVTHHWHDEAEFVFVSKGTVDVQVGAETYRVPKGHGVFIHPGEIHTLTPPDNSDSECYAVVFSTELLSSAHYDTIQHQFMNPLLEEKMRLPVYFSPEVDWAERALTHISQLIEYFERKPEGHHLAIKGLLYLFLSTLASYKQLSFDLRDPFLHGQNLTRLKAVLSYIDEHISEKIRLNHLAALCNMSEGHFCRYFKQMTNKRPVEYINDCRVSIAAELLQRTDRTVMDIALDVGFDNLSYFIKVFRSVKHCTPSEYRHLMAEK